LAVFFEGGEEFAHGAFEAVFEPAALEMWTGLTFFCPELDGLFIESGAEGSECAFASADGGGVLLAVLDMSIQVDTDLGTFKVGYDLGQEGRFYRLPGVPLYGSVYLLAGFSGEESSGNVKPVDAEIVKQEVVNFFEWSVGGPCVIEVQVEVYRSDFSDDSRFNGFAAVGKVGSPAAILVYGEMNSVLVGEVDEFLTQVEVGHEGFLAEDVFPGSDAVAEYWSAVFRMESDVDDGDFLIFNDTGRGVGDGGLWIKFTGSFFRPLVVHIANGGNFEPHGSVSPEVVFGYAACADEADFRLFTTRFGWEVIKLGGWKFSAFLEFTQAVFGHQVVCCKLFLYYLS